MEVNKDEAQRCLTLSRTHFHSGNLPSAIKFAKKSIALYSTPEAVEFLSKLNEADEKKSDPPPSESDAGSSTPRTEAKASGAEAHPSASGTSRRHGDGASSSSSKGDYTPEQAKVVKRVRACKVTAYYEILELQKDCDEEDIKKAYRKLALKLHPDKNRAPGADEAFKMVSTAFTILSDSNKRAIYDANPNVDPTKRGAGGFGGGGFDADMFGGGRGFQQTELSPEDLFNFIFNGGGPGFGGGGFGGPGVSFSFGPGGFTSFGGGPGFGGNVRRRPQQRAGPEEPQTQAQKIRSTILSLAPLLIFLFLSMLSSLPDFFTSNSQPPQFSFTPSSYLSHQRVTPKLKVPYYVHPEAFHQHQMWDPVPVEQRTQPDATNRKVQIFEHDVERTYVATLRHQCQRQLEDRERRVQDAIGVFGIGVNWEQVKKMKEEEFESCQLYTRYQRMGYQ